MAHVNLNTGEIHGTEKGSLTYYHEVAHIKFTQLNKHGEKVRVIQDMSFRSIVFSGALNVIYTSLFLKLILVLILLTNIFSELYEEKWCWKYAREVKEDDERIKEVEQEKV